MDFPNQLTRTTQKMVCDKCVLLHFDYSKFFKVKHISINKWFKWDYKKATIFYDSCFFFISC